MDVSTAGSACVLDEVMVFLPEIPSGMLDIPFKDSVHASNLF